MACTSCEWLRNITHRMIENTLLSEWPRCKCATGRPFPSGPGATFYTSRPTTHVIVPIAKASWWYRLRIRTCGLGLTALDSSIMVENVVTWIALLVQTQETCCLRRAWPWPGPSHDAYRRLQCRGQT